MVIAGEADTDEHGSQTGGRENRFVRENLPLPHLAACSRKVFVGHDSGISHIAAAVGALPLLFGWTDPA
jgi:ADP-heptose:LPS heptosyltransferase